MACEFHKSIKFNKATKEWNCTVCFERVDFVKWSIEVKKRKLLLDNNKKI